MSIIDDFNGSEFKFELQYYDPKLLWSKLTAARLRTEVPSLLKLKGSTSYRLTSAPLTTRVSTTAKWYTPLERGDWLEFTFAPHLIRNLTTRTCPDYQEEKSNQINNEHSIQKNRLKIYHAGPKERFIEIVGAFLDQKLGDFQMTILNMRKGDETQTKSTNITHPNIDLKNTFDA